jgi:hypothetical protein
MHLLGGAVQKKFFIGMLTALAVAVSAPGAPAAPTPASPGACNMLNVSTTGMDGMLRASPQGVGNMIALIGASEAADCRL